MPVSPPGPWHGKCLTHKVVVRGSRRRIQEPPKSTRLPQEDLCMGELLGRGEDRRFDALVAVNTPGFK